MATRAYLVGALMFLIAAAAGPVLPDWVVSLATIAFANALVVREGTVKYHVKNILRKLGATSRADAVSRYVRAMGAGSS